MRTRGIVACIGAALTACTPGDTFVCGQSAMCTLDGVRGTCEASRYCSFPDASCASGRRYGAWAEAALAHRCVEDGIDLAAPDLGTSDSAAADLATGDMAAADLAACTIAWRDTRTAFNDSLGAVQIDLPRPNGTTAGDLLIAGIYWGSTSFTALQPMVAPAGWTLIRRVDKPPEGSLSVYYKRAGASEPASYRFSCPTDDFSAAAWISAYSGVDQATPIDVESGKLVDVQQSVYSTDPIDTMTSSTQVLYTVAGFDATTLTIWTAHTGTNLRGTINNGARKSIMVGDVARPAAGTAGPFTATANHAQVYALIEAVAVRACR